MGIFKRAAIATVVLGAGLAAFYVGAGEGWFGRYEGPGKIEGKTIRQVPMTAQRTKQILFGDLHVHTTFSTARAAIRLRTRLILPNIVRHSISGP
jgi:hypothetical protein